MVCLLLVWGVCLVGLLASGLDTDSSFETSLDELLAWRPELTRPPDFERFWRDTLAELAEIGPEVRIEYAPDESRDEFDCFDVGYLSLGKRVVRGWLTVPRGDGPYPVAVHYHPRGGNRQVIPPANGIAAVSISWRGGSEDPEPPGWDVRGVDDPRRYVWRSMVANAERVCHLVDRMPGVDPERLGLVGFSMGGALAIIVGGLLRERVSFISTVAPGPGYWFLKDGTPSESRGSVRSLLEYMREHPESEAAVRRTISYFEAMNFAPDVTAPVWMSVGLRDTYCTPEMTMGVYNHLRCPRRLEVYREGGHGKGGGMTATPVVPRWVGTGSGGAGALAR